MKAMRSNQPLNVFVYSDSKSLSDNHIAFLNDYDDYKVHFIPTAMELFEVMKWGPDLIVLDSQAKKVVKCCEWAA